MARFRTRTRLVAAGVVCGLLVAGLAPVNVGAAGGGGSAVGLDKFLHAVGYAICAAAFVPALSGPRTRRVAGAIVGAILLGVGIELLQWPLSWRHASALDALANAAGAFVGGGAWWLVGRDR